MSVRQPMQIVHAVDYGGPYRGSFIPMLVAVAKEAADREYSCTIKLSGVARGRPWLPDLHAVADTGFISTGGSRWSSIPNTMSELHSALNGGRSPAVIHTHFAAFDIPAALMRARRRNLAVFWHEHGPILDDPRVRLRNSLRYASLGRVVDGMLCVSPELRAELLSRHAPTRHLYDFPNAIDAQVFAPATAAERSSARSALGLADEDRVVLHFGWDWKRKGGDELLGAADLLAAEPDLVLLTVLGEKNPPLSLVKQHANVRPLPPADDVKQLYAAADVFLSCGRAEGMPLATMEALACGLPIVVSDIPMQQRLANGLPGAKSVPVEPTRIAAGLREMLSLSEAQREEHVAMGVERIKSRFALGAWARNLVDLYETVLSRRGS